MGGAVSSGRDNSDLVDNLVDAAYILTPQVEDAFRAVDRGDYFYEAYRDSAYKDCAWRQGPLHLSAPCIYAKVAEALDLRSGLRFLNMGSGTGYLSTVIGLLLGSRGVNHGIELNAEAVAYAHMKLQEFKRDSPAFDEFDFCEPIMLVGNCLQLTDCSHYDRVYCGAACPDEHVDFVKNLLKVGGIAVVPVDDKLLRIERTGESTWDSKSILSVSFATLVTPAEGTSATTVRLPEPKVMPLLDLSRKAVRDVLRAKLQNAIPRPDFRRPRRADDASSADGSDLAREHGSLVHMLFPMNRSSSSSSSSSGDVSEASVGHSDAEDEAIEDDGTAEEDEAAEEAGAAEEDEAAEQAGVECHRLCTATGAAAADSSPADFVASDPERVRQAGVHDNGTDNQPSPSSTEGMEPENTGEADPSCAMDTEQLPAVGLCKRKADECVGAANEAVYADLNVRADANLSSRSSSRSGGSGSCNSLDSSCSSSKRRQTCPPNWELSMPVPVVNESQRVVPASPADGTAADTASEAAAHVEMMSEDPAAVSFTRACYGEPTTSKPLITGRADEDSCGAAAAAVAAVAAASAEWQRDAEQSNVPAPSPSNAEAAVKVNATGAGDVNAAGGDADSGDVSTAASLVNTTSDDERQSTHVLTEAPAMTGDADEAAQQQRLQQQQQQEERAQRIGRVVQLTLGRLHAARRVDAAGGSSSGGGSQGPVVVGFWRPPATGAGAQEQQRASLGDSSGGGSAPAPAQGPVNLHRALLETVERCDGGLSDGSPSDDNRADEEAEFARRRRAQQDYHRAFSRSMTELVEGLPLPEVLKSYISYGRRSKGDRVGAGRLC